MFCVYPLRLIISLRIKVVKCQFNPQQCQHQPKKRCLLCQYCVSPSQELFIIITRCQGDFYQKADYSSPGVASSISTVHECTAIGVRGIGDHQAFIGGMKNLISWTCRVGKKPSLTLTEMVHRVKLLTEGKCIKTPPSPKSKV